MNQFDHGFDNVSRSSSSVRRYRPTNPARVLPPITLRKSLKRKVRIMNKFPQRFVPAEVVPALTWQCVGCYGQCMAPAYIFQSPFRYVCHDPDCRNNYLIYPSGQVELVEPLAEVLSADDPSIDWEAIERGDRSSIDRR